MCKGKGKTYPDFKQIRTRSRDATLARLLAVAGQAVHYLRALAIAPTAAPDRMIHMLSRPRSDADPACWITGATIVAYSELITDRNSTNRSYIQQPELLECLCDLDRSISVTRWFKGVSGIVLVGWDTW